MSPNTNLQKTLEKVIFPIVLDHLQGKTHQSSDEVTQEYNQIKKSHLQAQNSKKTKGEKIAINLRARKCKEELDNKDNKALE